MRSVALFVLVLGVFAVAPTRAGETDSRADRVEALARSGDDDGAIALGEEALRQAPGDAALWRALGEAYGGKARKAPVLARFGLARKCRAAFERAVELAPGDVEARWALFTYYLEAPAIVGGGAARARVEAEAIAKLDFIRGHCALGALLLREKDLAGAESEYRRVLESHPENGEGRAGLGAVLLEQGRFDDARRLWSGLLDDPDLGRVAHYQLGRISLESGNGLDEGVEHFKLYLAVAPPPEDPTLAEADWRLGLLYEKLGRREEAIGALRDAVRRDPDLARAKKDLKRLGG